MSHSGESGELIVNIFSALAQCERRLIQQKTKAGLAAAHARGRSGGRPKVTASEPKVVLAKKLNADKTWRSTTSARRCGSRGRRSIGACGRDRVSRHGGISASKWLKAIMLDNQFAIGHSTLEILEFVIVQFWLLNT
jgi:DNA invertase Pin-like site-specific DNA recombinase